MDDDGRPSLARRLRRLVTGPAHDPTDPKTFHRLALVAFFAWVGLGADGLSSSCYGPPEAFQVLLDYPHLAIFVGLGTAFTIMVISTAYSQIIELFPSGGGGYLVASRLLNPTVGMISGCALIIDYVLTIALSISSGADAVFSFLPISWHPYRFEFALCGVLVLTALNMRGVKESVMPLLPVFLIFVVTHALAIVYVLATHVSGLGEFTQRTVTDVRAASGQLGLVGMFLLLFRAYSMGAGTYTGIEAVSNGLPILREPRQQTGRRTMVYMASSLIFTVVGLLLAYTLTGSTFQEGKTLNAVMLERMTGSWSHGLARTFVLVTLISEGAILFVAAQTGFLDGPRVLANMSLDRWFPSRFAMLSDRLVTQNGVLLMGAAAISVMMLAKGSVHYLLVLYSITVFITFVLSQLGMVRHWWQARHSGKRWVRGIVINGTGLLLTALILCSMVAVKFASGGWITLVITGTLITLALLIRRHYESTAKLLRRLDTLIEMPKLAMAEPAAGVPAYQPESKTAIVLVNGYNGLGLHTLFAVLRLFHGTFKNFVFVQVGVIDVGTFKGVDEVARLKQHVESELKKYVAFMNHQGYFAAAASSIGPEVVDEIAQMVPRVIVQYPTSICFAGQLVFPEETFFTRLLHNHIVFAVQQRLYRRGIPLVILPIRV